MMGIKNKLLFIIVFMLSSCQKEQSPSLYWGEISAVVNDDTAWEAEVYGRESRVDDSTVSILVNKYHNGIVVEKLRFVDVLKQEGRYELSNTDSNGKDLPKALFMLTSHDNILDWYEIYTEEENYIQIEYINKETKELRGSFQASFVFGANNSNKTIPDAPDTIRFTRGQFLTKITD